MTRQRETVELTAEQVGWIEVYRAAQREIERAETQKAEARRHIEEALGAAEIGVRHGHVQVNWLVVASNRLDQKKLKEQHPDIYEAFSKRQFTRRFIVEDPSEGS